MKDTHEATEQTKPAQKCTCECHNLTEDLSTVGASVLETTKGLREEALRQAQKHPLAAFGAAFVAGLMVARALRR